MEHKESHFFYTQNKILRVVDSLIVELQMNVGSPHNAYNFLNFHDKNEYNN
jgi:hypothetical protein